MIRIISRTLLAMLGALALTAPSYLLAYDNASIFTPGNLSAVTAHGAKPERTLFTNVHVFDGKNEKRLMNANVLIEGSLVKDVSDKPITADGEQSTNSL